MQYMLFRFDTYYSGTNPWRVEGNLYPSVAAALVRASIVCLGQGSSMISEARQTSTPGVWKLLCKERVNSTAPMRIAAQFAIVPMPSAVLSPDALEP
jgi:hypothetical protein